MSTVPWDKAWAVDIVDLKVTKGSGRAHSTKGSGRAHRLIIDGRLDDASTDLDLDAETAGYVIGLGCARGVLACVRACVCNVRVYCVCVRACCVCVRTSTFWKLLFVLYVLCSSRSRTQFNPT